MTTDSDIFVNMLSRRRTYEKRKRDREERKRERDKEWRITSNDRIINPKEKFHHKMPMISIIKMEL